jgi:hypothetical protein
MSLLKSKRKVIANRGAFVAVLAPRLGGKSTLAGTLPGRSAMFTTRTFETGSASAEKLAKDLGAHLDVFEFSSGKELIAMAKEAVDEGYENLYVDGVSGLTELAFRSPEVTKKMTTNVWDAYALLGDTVEEVLLSLKEIAEKDGGPNIFVTAAIEPKHDAAGNVIEMVVESRGKSVLKGLRRLFPVVVSLVPAYDDDGNKLDVPQMLCKTDGVHPGRIDSLLAQDNPGRLDADLQQLITLIKTGAPA